MKVYGNTPADELKHGRGPTPADPAVLGRGMSERELQEAIIELAVALKFHVYHTHDSRRSVPGFPDLTLVNGKRRRTIFAELKTTRGVVTPDQFDWLTTLATAGNHVHLWRPVDWLTGSIERELRGPRI